jgi:hypothetical protein
MTTAIPMIMMAIVALRSRRPTIITSTVIMLMTTTLALPAARPSRLRQRLPTPSSATQSAV